MKIRDMRNMGPKSEAMLNQAGISDADQLRQLGAVAAYLQVLQEGAKPSLNLLYVIEGALTDRDWRDLGHGVRESLIMAMDAAMDKNYFE